MVILECQYERAVAMCKKKVRRVYKKKAKAQTQIPQTESVPRTIEEETSNAPDERPESI